MDCEILVTVICTNLQNMKQMREPVGEMLLQDAGFRCSCQEEGECALSEIILSDNRKIKQLTMNLAGPSSNAPVCSIAESEDRFNELLSLLAPNGAMTILYKNKLPKTVLKSIAGFKDEFDFTEYFANKDFSVFFPRKNLNTLYFYYSNINIKPKIVRQSLKWIIKLRLYSILYLIHSSNKSLLVIRKNAFADC